MIYSDYLETMIDEWFIYNGHRYEWSEDDLVYWNIETEEDYFEIVPEGAITEDDLNVICNLN